MNNQTNFDSTTGQPINQDAYNVSAIPNVSNTPTTIQPQNLNQTVQVVEIPQNLQSPVINTQQLPGQNLNQDLTQQQLQNIPTIEQSKREFIDNTEANNTTNKKEQKKEGINIAFLIILVVIILVAIFFLFPLLMNL